MCVVLCVDIVRGLCNMYNCGVRMCVSVCVFSP